MAKEERKYQPILPFFFQPVCWLLPFFILTGLTTSIAMVTQDVFIVLLGKT